MTFSTGSRLALGALFAALVLAPAAAAHVEIAPDEAQAGFEGRFAIQVPNEEADATTVKVVVKFPEEVPVASFQPVEGWTRTVKTVKLATPITDDDGNQVSERIDTVTWEGGEIKPGEFQEFGMSFALPEDAGTLVFPATQTYSNGDVVRWIGPEDSDEPAPRLTVEAAGGDSSAGSTGAEEPATTAATDTGASEVETTAVEPASAESDDSDGRANLALIVAVLGLLAGLAALGWVLVASRKT